MNASKSNSFVIGPIGEKTRLTIVCCQHGDEPFGKRVFDALFERLQEFPQIKLILANPEALIRGERFIDEDLNRAFPGSPDGNREAVLAHRINQEIQEGDFLLDIHTTLSNIKMTPIITKMTEPVKRILNACDSKEVAYMQSGMGSLIHQVENGVSLEFGREYSLTDEALAEAIEVVVRLLAESRKPTSRKVFFIDGSIPKDGSVILPKVVTNFRKITSLGVYPFLFHRNSYPTIYCHTASRYETMAI
jgi:succinylglutamate desuccinylase